MLILTRRIGEVICINDDIKIVVLASRGNQIRFGIEAPKDVIIFREEIYKRLLNEAGVKGLSELKQKDLEALRQRYSENRYSL